MAGIPARNTDKTAENCFMKIELKNIKHSPSLSEETACYSASLYVDGKKIGVVSNQGHGGPDMFQGDRSKYEEANNWVKANMPPLDTPYSDEPLEMDIELLCGELFDDWVAAKKLRTIMRSRVLIIKPGQKEIVELRFKGIRKIHDAHIAVTRKKYPDATVLNTLPFEEALKLCRKYT